MAVEKKMEQAAPKWGTKEWIAAYPWSRMDRKRRRRVAAVLPEGCRDPLAWYVGKVPYLHACTANTQFSSRKDAERVCRLLNQADSAAMKVVDALVAAWLTEAWGLRTAAAKGGK